MLRELLRQTGKAPEEVRVAIQGYGSLGITAHQAFAAQGMKVVAVSDSHGGVFAPEGLPPKALGEHKMLTGLLRNFPRHGGTDGGGDLRPGRRRSVSPPPWSAPSTSTMRRTVRAKIVLELANAPTTPEADRILEDRGVLVAPDVLANSGGGHGELLRMDPGPHRGLLVRGGGAPPPGRPDLRGLPGDLGPVGSSSASPCGSPPSCGGWGKVLRAMRLKGIWP